jgi:hypothetical protein
MDARLLRILSFSAALGLLLACACHSGADRGSTANGGIGGFGPPWPPSDGPGCGQTALPVQPVPPDILIVQDKGLSMNDDGSDSSCDGGCGVSSKWSQVSAAVVDATSLTQDSVNWGLKFLGNDSTCGVLPGVAVPVGPSSAAEIQSAFADSRPAGYRSTAAALNSAVAYLETLTDLNPKYLLLVTDGLPGCSPGGMNATADDSTGAETAVLNAASAGYNTFVVGISTASDLAASATLNSMAVSGREPQTRAASLYYAATDTASLEAILQAIIGVAQRCLFSLAGAPVGFTDLVVVADDGSGNQLAITHDPANGFSVDATQTFVVLNGSACDNLKSGAYTNFELYFACAGTPLTPP